MLFDFFLFWVFFWGNCLNYWENSRFFPSLFPIVSFQETRRSLKFVWKDLVNENVKVFFRVNKVIKNCTVLVECGGKIILQKKKKICVPGEMETALILQDKLSGLSGDITVSVKGEL